MKTTPKSILPSVYASLAVVALVAGCGSNGSFGPSTDASPDSPPDLLSDLDPGTRTDGPRDLFWEPGPDAPLDLRGEVFWDPGPDMGPDLGQDAPRDIGFDGPSHDGPGGTVDGGPCLAGQVLGYTTPGCGGDAKPVCVHAIQDACARYACGCSGKLIVGCDYWSEPWSTKTTASGDCGGSTDPDGGSVDTDPGETAPVDAGTCPGGTVRVEPHPSAMSQFTAFCGQPCSTTADCPTGFHCVDLLVASPNPGPVCVSATVPPPVANPMPGWHWDMTPVCQSESVIGATYNEPNNQVAGHELLTCPNGCVATADGGRLAHCR